MGGPNAPKQVTRDTKLKLISKKPGFPTTNVTNLEADGVFYKKHNKMQIRHLDKTRCKAT